MVREKSLLDRNRLDAGSTAVYVSRYAEIFERPLARRDERTARPPFVAIRARKPCFFARLRLFGWNVRFVVMMNPFLLPRRFGRLACLLVGPQLAEGVTVGEVVDKGQTGL